MLFVMLVLAVYGLCILGVAKLPNSALGLVLKFILGTAILLISIWLIWLAIMVFGVGPNMKNL